MLKILGKTEVFFRAFAKHFRRAYLSPLHWKPTRVESHVQGIPFNFGPRLLNNYARTAEYFFFGAPFSWHHLQNLIKTIKGKNFMTIGHVYLDPLYLPNVDVV